MPLLLPTHNLDVQPSLAKKVAELGVWGFTGVCIHVFAKGIQQKPLLARPHLHAVWAAVFVGVGHFAQKFEERQMLHLLNMRDRLVKRRMLRDEQ